MSERCQRLAVYFMLVAISMPLLSCSLPTDVAKIPLGKIVDVDIRPGGFGTPSITIIKTEKKVVSIDRILSVDIGVEAWEIRDSKGRIWFTWTGSSYKYRVYW